MPRRRMRWLLLAAAFVAPPLVVGAVRVRELGRRQQPELLPRLSAETVLPTVPAHDPDRRTVAVLLGADLTEVTDALGPYEMFARAGVFNVYMVAPERQPTLLSGGLRILPHLSLSELDARLAGRPPAIVVVPQIPNIGSAVNRPLVGWMQRQAAAGALMHSWCTGAMALAEAGLLDGLTATAHWGDLDRLAKQYPRVQWVRGVRWVDHGHVITSAGLTSGVDASLRVLAKTAGDDIARRVADELRYPNYVFASQPTAPQYTVRAQDAILLVNVAYRFRRQQIGLAVYDGVGELDLSNLYDTHAYSAVADVHAVAARPGFVHTAHGLTLIPSLIAAPGDARVLGALDRFVVPGADIDRSADVVAGMRSVASRLDPTYLHRDAKGRFGLEPVIEDLARTADAPTAQFALRRLEYRSTEVSLAGGSIPWAAVPLPLGVGILGVAAFVLIGRLTNRERHAKGRPYFGRDRRYGTCSDGCKAREGRASPPLRGRPETETGR
jgi:AraC family transcriptional regulator, transcriptional activator FtrA